VKGVRECAGVAIREGPKAACKARILKVSFFLSFGALEVVIVHVPYSRHEESHSAEES